MRISRVIAALAGGISLYLAASMQPWWVLKGNALSAYISPFSVCLIVLNRPLTIPAIDYACLASRLIYAYAGLRLILYAAISREKIREAMFTTAPLSTAVLFTASLLVGCWLASARLGVEIAPLGAQTIVYQGVVRNIPIRVEIPVVATFTSYYYLALAAAALNILAWLLKHKQL